MLEQSLKKLGFSEHEASIYSVLLANSPAGASFIASKCNLSRSSVYTVLNSLISKGLVSVTYKNEVKQFIAEGYSALEQRLKKEKNEVDGKFRLLENLKENIQMLTKDDLNIPQVMFFEGQEGLKRIYTGMMRQAPQDSIMHIMRDEFVWQNEWSFVFSQEWHDRIKKIKAEKNIQTKLLVNGSKTEKEKVGYYKSRKNLEFKYLRPKNSVKQFAFYLVGDTVSIMSMENNNLIGIKIVNQHLTENFMQIFQILWGKEK
ncbi:hypothetical protein ISS03_02465 [Patescibacteria group bacterium]|nr:hypothetical protein [Patescibacteria group bacterium]